MKRLMFGALLFALQTASAGNLPEVGIMMMRTNALYRCGEQAEFAVTVGEGDVGGLSLRATLSNDGRDVMATNVLDLSSGRRCFVLSGTMTKPGFLRLTVEAERKSEKDCFDACAAFEPEKITTAMEKPADFDAFWEESFRELKAIPPDFRLTPMKNAPKGIETYAISAATVNGKRIWGFISIPKDKTAKYPINMTLPSAGNGVNLPTYGKGRSIELVVIVHDNPVGVPDAVFKANHKSVMNRGCGTEDRTKCLDGCRSGFYPWFGAEDRKRYYFRPVFLGISRLLDYTLARPEWNGRDVNVTGHSQGGGLSLILTALRQDVVTSTCVAAPGFCDHAGHEAGRETGWPWLVGAIAGDSRKDAAVAARRRELNRELTGYYDACFFCDRIKTPVAVAVGFTDRICVPSSVFAAYNRIPSAHKHIVHDVTHGHAVSDAANAKARQWLRRELADVRGKSMASVRSPDGRNEIRLRTDPLSVEVLRDGVQLVAPSEIDLAIGERFLSGLLSDPVLRRNEVRGVCQTPVGKKDVVSLEASEMFVDCGDWGVRLSARDDGVAYRFEISRGGTVRVTDEKASVCLADGGAKCWCNRTKKFGEEETVSESGTAREVRTDKDQMVYLPFVCQVGGKTLAVAESDVRDYPIWNIERGGDSPEVVFYSKFARWPKRVQRVGGWGDVLLSEGGRWIRVEERENYLVDTKGTRTFPWRVFILADEPAKLCEADIVTALAAPVEKGADFGWVKPGKVAWDWWNCFDNLGNSGCNTKTYERFIDFAAKTGIEYVIFDEGWSEELNIWKYHHGVDVPHLIEYATKKNVGIILWMAWAQIFGQEEKVAAHFAKLGAKGFKVDFMDRGDAGCARFLEKFAAACAKEKMVVDYHGVYRPTGLQRKYPNILNYEGVHGLEWMKMSQTGPDIVDNDVRVAFLRMTAGPMDYTPGAMLNFTNAPRSDLENFPGAYGTRARQMAMMALFEAPLQMLCDSPTLYERNAECFDFMAKTPTVWSKTVGLGGTPDTFALVARQARDGSWYVACISNWEPREVSFGTDILGAGDWRLETFRDAPDSARVATRYVHETKTVRVGERQRVAVAPGGGFVMRFSK